ncbi:MAG: hypothetical protein E6Q95_02345 [Chitinophagaceae bacterium]|nr:MAG: hypothetical protein E6Q95_02345 [Chitinophagaceae bacterium]
MQLQILAQTTIRGKVVDEKNNPLEFATIVLNNGTQDILTRKSNAMGVFSFNINNHSFDSVKLIISYINKSTQSFWVNKKEFSLPLQIKLLDQSLTLHDIVVSGVVKNKNSASSIVFDEEAIRQLQAFSLADVLNTLPGRKTEAPNLQSPQTLQLRTSSTGADAMNNSFGIAVFIDGVRISNETNMQSRALSSRGLSGSLLAGSGQSSADVAFNGFDLRDIPMSNIASIEVIQGVGSARYGDFTNGAILITTKAGRTPYSFNTNINGGSSSFSLSKGFELNKKAGAINLSLGFLNSNNDPRDKVKTYNNLNASLKWTKGFSKNIINSFSFNAETNLDDTKTDPDDDAQKMNYSKRYNYRFSNNTNIDIDKNWLDELSILANFSIGKQNSYTQWLLNGMPKGIASKDTTGVYEGYFIPGNYLAVEHIDGKPISYSVNIDAQTKLLKWGSLQNQMAFGLSFNASGNKGLGNIVDPERPRWTNQGMQNERDFNYRDSVDFENNFAAYVQNNLRGKILDKRFNLGVGLRLNAQEGRVNPQPRISFNFYIHKNWSLSSSYGISFKSPSLAHIYTAPTFFDVPLLNLYTGYAKNSLFLVYTHKTSSVSRNLKNAVTYQFEQGVNFQSQKIGSGNLFAYYKKNKNGFVTYTEYLPIDVPVYDYKMNADSTISYFPTGATSKSWDLKRSRMSNGLQSKDYGLQFSFQTKMIQPIATILGMRAGYSISKYIGKMEYSTELASMMAQQKGIVYVDYVNAQTHSKQAMISFNTNTHIPQIGFIVSLIADYEPLLKQKWEANNIYPIAYSTSLGERKELSVEESMSNDWAYLRKNATEEKLVIPSTGFWNLNMRVAKEIKKKIRLSVSAFNVFNLKPKAFQTSEDKVSFYSYKPISLTIGASIQL